MNTHAFAVLFVGGLGLAVVVWVLHKLGKALAAIVFLALWWLIKGLAWAAKQIVTHPRTTLTVLTLVAWCRWLGWPSLVITLAALAAVLSVWRWVDLVGTAAVGLHPPSSHRPVVEHRPQPPPHPLGPSGRNPVPRFRRNPPHRLRRAHPPRCQCPGKRLDGRDPHSAPPAPRTAGRPPVGGGRMNAPATPPATSGTRAERMRLPLSSEVMKATAEKHGVCVRPSTMEVGDPDTGELRYVGMPCGSTVENVCAPCAKKAKALRMAQCREGWHLTDEPDFIPTPPTDDQKELMTFRADLVVRYREAAWTPASQGAHAQNHAGSPEKQSLPHHIKTRPTPLLHG